MYYLLQQFLQLSRPLQYARQHGKSYVQLQHGTGALYRLLHGAVLFHELRHQATNQPIRVAGAGFDRGKQTRKPVKTISMTWLMNKSIENIWALY